jgi:hypothetical protein
MKVKTLRFKDTKEFVHILEGGQMGTSEIPDVLPMTASIDALKLYYTTFDPPKEVDYENLEVVEYDFIESGEVGADIRNKLSPPLNLVSLLEDYLDPDSSEGKRKVIMNHIQPEMVQTLINIEYLSKLF